MDHIYEEILSPCRRLGVNDHSDNGHSRSDQRCVSERSGDRFPVYDSISDRSGSSGKGHGYKRHYVSPPTYQSSPKATRSHESLPDQPTGQGQSRCRPMKVLQNEGQLKVSAYMNFGLLTVHVIQARHLSSKSKPLCDSFIKMTLIPEDGKKSRCYTDVVTGSNNPLFDDKISFELSDEDYNKRLLISVWHRDSASSEFLGCMSFGIRHLLNPKREVSGWYYLLTEDIGRKKHLQVSQKQNPRLTLRHQANVPSVNKDVWGLEPITVTVHRGKHGFGFSVVESCPVKVGRVDGASPAETAGLIPGDCIIRINNQNVSRSQAVSVAKLVKNSGNTLVIDLQRRKALEILDTYDEIPPPPPSLVAPPPSIMDPMDVRKGTDYDHSGEYSDSEGEGKENRFSVDEGIYSLPSHLITSTPLPLFMNGHQTVVTAERCRQEAVHRLLSLELDFIDVMHAGMQRFSRPLRHCILSPQQHLTLFQNIEKLVTISEYHVKQIHDNMPSISSDTDASVTSSEGGSEIFHSIGLIYKSKVHMLSQAYDLYSKGLGEANVLLLDLSKSGEFVKFIREPSMDPQQPTISAFISRPVQHIRELYTLIREIFVNTSGNGESYYGLKQVVESLQECVTGISNYSCVDRVPSLSSVYASSDTSHKNRSQSDSHSSGSDVSRPLLQPSSSLQTVRSVDSEVMRIQDRLVFPPQVRVFQLCQEERHLIYSGDMFKWEGSVWKKLHVMLFSDLLLQTEKDKDNFYHVVHQPLYLQDISSIDGQRKHTTELVLHCLTHSGDNSAHPLTPGKILFRAPTTEMKFTWKSLLEQRVGNLQGSTAYYSMSESSGSAIII
ncbi:hypothetical protein FSP39_018747 [Pinctada imbricata]|uniref:Uncharacterized protein n=1 Tax=Pinctada imbricata TaxID=66713 RepID=A0AA88XN38_PINIB|nr:hypothetical protein FSP39_018747 [Pinctada imbricata]